MNDKQLSKIVSQFLLPNNLLLFNYVWAGIGQVAYSRSRNMLSFGERESDADSESDGLLTAKEVNGRREGLFAKCMKVAKLHNVECKMERFLHHFQRNATLKAHIARFADKMAPQRTDML